MKGRGRGDRVAERRVERGKQRPPGIHIYVYTYIYMYICILLIGAPIKARWIAFDWPKRLLLATPEGERHQGGTALPIGAKRSISKIYTYIYIYIYLFILGDRYIYI